MPVGPTQRTPKRDPDTKMMVLPVRMAEPDVQVLDAGWKRLGFRTRMAFLREAMAALFEAKGEALAATVIRAG